MDSWSSDLTERSKKLELSWRNQMGGVPFLFNFQKYKMSKMFNLFTLFNVLLLCSLFVGCLDVNKTANGESIPLAPGASSTPSASPQTPRFIDFNIKDVRLGDLESDVLKRLGNPDDRRIEKVDFCGIDEFLVLGYPGIDLKLDRGNDGTWSVLEIEVTSPRILVDPGIKIGDERDLLLQKFGEPFAANSNGNDSELSYLTRDNDNAEFLVRADKIVRIRLYVNPC